MLFSAIAGRLIYAGTLRVQGVPQPKVEELLWNRVISFGAVAPRIAV
jgi:hypothetical protein